jgi:hypothetical protein
MEPVFLLHLRWNGIFGSHGPKFLDEENYSQDLPQKGLVNS